MLFKENSQGDIWWALTGSNRRHSACKADALPTELSALRTKNNSVILDRRPTRIVVLDNQ